MNQSDEKSSALNLAFTTFDFKTYPYLFETDSKKWLSVSVLWWSLSLLWWLSLTAPSDEVYLKYNTHDDEYIGKKNRTPIKNSLRQNTNKNRHFNLSEILINIRLKNRCGHTKSQCAPVALVQTKSSKSKIYLRVFSGLIKRIQCKVPYIE